jgi:chemotaxis family two-component system sensor kinase Cph1
MTDDDLDLTACDVEPIHVPGAVQPHGVLLALAPDLTVAQVSESVAAHLARPPAAVLGRPLADLVGADPAAAVAAAVASGGGDAGRVIAPSGARLAARVHQFAGATILELEPADDERGATISAELRVALAELQGATSVAALCDAVARTVRRLTGFERVMLYRFDEDDHGEVVAEAAAGGLEPYLGLHYPASDIPRQARELYRQTWVRIIPDARYLPSPLLPALRRDTGAPLDLRFAALRSISPIHLRYLANMGARASMSVSLVVRDRLWGLIACLEHSGPHAVGPAARAACEGIGRLVSLQIGALDERERTEVRAARRSTLDLLARAMAADPDDALAGLTTAPAALLSLVDAAGAAVLTDGERRARTAGRVPPAAFIDELARWLDQRALGLGAPFATASLAADLPSAADLRDLASGLLTIALPGDPPRRLLWFRPEVVETVYWGGDPRKPVEPPSDPTALPLLHPRRSFAKWRDEVRLRSARWTPSDLDAADELRRRAVELDLSRQLARAQRAVRVRDELVAVVSHDLRNPMNVIQMQATALLRTADDGEPESPARLRAAADRIQRSIDRMTVLVTDLLDLARIEAGGLELDRQPRPLRDLIDEALALARPLADAKHLRLLEDLEDCTASVDRNRLHQVVSNIVGNAIKFTPEGGSVTVSTRCLPTEIHLSVTDTGPGIPAHELPHLFDRYWQSRRAARAADGAGLGLYIARSIVEAHGGRIWASPSPTGGTTFTFSLPRP